MGDCEHNWTHDAPVLMDDGKERPLRPYIHFCVTSEEPTYYPPQGLFPVEFCTKCHLLRVMSSKGESQNE